MNIVQEAEYMSIDQNSRKYALANAQEIKEGVSFKNLVYQLTLPIYNVKIGSCMLDLFYKNHRNKIFLTHVKLW